MYIESYFRILIYTQLCVPAISLGGRGAAGFLSFGDSKSWSVVRDGTSSLQPVRPLHCQPTISPPPILLETLEAGLGMESRKQEDSRPCIPHARVEIEVIQDAAEGLLK